MKNKRRILLIALAVLTVIAGTFTVLAATGNLPANTKSPSTSNPDDAIEHIQYQTNDLGGYEYS